MRRAVLLSVAGVLVVAVGAAVLVGVLTRTEPSDNANGSVPVRDLRSIAGEYVSINDTGAPARVLHDAPIRITVEKDRVLAHAGCNSMQGRARVDEGRLLVPELAMTEMGCPDELAAQDQWVLQMLQAGPHLERSGPYLSLTWDGYWLGLSSDPVDRPVVSPSA